MKIIAKILMAIVLVLALISGCGGPNVANPTETIPGPQTTNPVEDITNPTTTPSEVTDPTTPSEGDGDITQPTDPTDDVTTPTEPTEPSVPSEPTTPTIPSEPSEPTTPTVPSEPTDPTVPSVPTTPTEPPVTDYTLKLSKQTLSLVVGKSETLTCTYTGTGTLTWSSSNDSVATVSNGKVTAKAVGTAKITVTDGEKQAQCDVAVKDYTLSLNRDTLKLTVGDVGSLTCTYTGTGTLSWSSNKTSVATVSSGRVTAKAAGTAEITVTDGVKSDTCTVIVEKKPETDYVLKVSPTTMTLNVGKTGNISYEYTGNKTLTWKSSNTSVATVSNGKVTAKAAGTAKITVTDGVKSDTCTVMVEKKPETDYILKVSPTTMTLNVGKTGNISYEYTGNKPLTWESSNTSVATVSDGKVTAKAAGTAVITLTDGPKRAQCVVTVKDYTLELNRDTLKLTVGDVGNLTCTYTGTGTLSWSSNKTSVATVSNGKVTAKAAGTAEITVTDGVKSDTCRVIVEKKPETDYILRVSPTTMTLEVGKTGNISYEYTGTGTLSWSSSNTSVATVSDGKVTAKAAGTAAITLTDGKKQAQCYVTVKPKPATATLTINTPKNTIVFVGETLKLDYTYTGTGKLTFASWDTSILTIDSNGKMKGVSEGPVGVEVTDGNLYKCVTIQVKGVKATSIKMINMEGPLFDGVTKYVGDYMSFRAYSKPDENPIKVSTSNASIVAVSSKVVNSFETEITLNYKAAGSATITLTSEDGCVVYKYKVNVKSEYSCYPGKEKLTPEEFADACTQVMVANGFKKDTGCTSYRVLTINANQLTWSNAKAFAQGYVRSWYPNGKDSCWISYEGTDEKGNYIFYTRWG